MDNTPFPGTLTFRDNDTSLPRSLPSEDNTTQQDMGRHNSTTTTDILQNFHSKGSHLPQNRERRKSSSSPNVRPGESIPSSPSHEKHALGNLPQLIRDSLQKPETERNPYLDPEKHSTESIHKKQRGSYLNRWRRSKFSTGTEEPSMDELASRVEYIFPCRGNLPVQVYDFGEGRTDRKLIKLGNIEQEMFNKPDWVVVRWIHAPLGIGLYHSSVEDIFLNGVGQEVGPMRKESKCLLKGKPFNRAGRVGWPYLETEIINIRSFESMKHMRQIAGILKSKSSVQSILDKKVFTGDYNQYLAKDVEWRGNHLSLEPTFWETVKSDLPWLLSDGDLNMKSPAAFSREIAFELEKQTLQNHPSYQNAYIARDSFRCFHRGDGYMLSLSPATGIDYLDKHLPHIGEEEDEKQDEELSWPEQGASAIAQVYAEFEIEGVSKWPQKNPEWLMVFLLTEIAITPHSMRSGYATSSILDAYDANVHKLIARKFEPWQRHETVSLVRSYLASRDELMALGQVYKNKLKFLRLLMEDCKEMASACQNDMTCQQGQYIDQFMTMTGRVGFAISAVEDLCSQCDQLVSNLTSSLNALFQLRSIEQNDRSITADSQSKAVFVFTTVTLVFLPLSFMTSYFSMNVHGIVDASPHISQTHFWEVCGPFTLCIVLIVGFYIYREGSRRVGGIPS